MITTENTAQASTQESAEAMARKAKALQMSATAGKAIGLMLVGALMAVGVTKLRNRNADTVA